MQGNSTECYVEKSRLGGSGVKNDTRKPHRNELSVGSSSNCPTKSLLN